jgi:hypothetical protein
MHGNQETPLPDISRHEPLHPIGVHLRASAARLLRRRQHGPKNLPHTTDAPALKIGPA